MKILLYPSLPGVIIVLCFQVDVPKSICLCLVAQIKRWTRKSQVHLFICGYNAAF